MSEDYRDAAQRHLQDAEFLYQLAPARMANASHLYGLSAECSLKVIARYFVATKKFNGQSGHIPRLFQELSNISSIGSNHDLVDAINKIQSKFNSWSINQRYENQAATTFPPDLVAKQQLATKEASLLMNDVLERRI